MLTISTFFRFGEHKNCHKIFNEIFCSIIASPRSEAVLTMGSRKRKLDVDGSPASDYEPVAESGSKTEQSTGIIGRSSCINGP